MDFIKKNKFTIIVTVFFILLVLVGVKAKDLFFPNGGKALYGNRLSGIEEVKINDQKFEQILASIKESPIVMEATKTVQGKLVKFQVTVTEETSVADAKTIAPKLIEGLEDKQKSYYDFQVFIKKEDPTHDNFPIIGYKHKNKQDFSWTKDRVESAK